MVIPVHILRQATDLYLRTAYPGGATGAPAELAARVRALPDSGEPVPLELFERDVANSAGSYALRLGQPAYPFMKLVFDPVPEGGGGCCGQDFLLRVDAHDRHLHAPPGTPDAAWLAGVRASNQALVEKIEGDWAAAGLPTFKEFLRRQLEEKKRARV